MRRSSIGMLLFSVAIALLGFVPTQGADAAATATAAEPPRPLKIVLLGDSYSAGNGARDANGDRDYYGPAGCYRSKSNWAELYVDSLRAAGYAVTFINRACSGAVTDNVLGNDNMKDKKSASYDVPPGTPVPTTVDEANALLEQKDLCDTGAYDDEFWKYEASVLLGSTIIYDCSRFMRPQIEAVGPDTDLVLFTIGGNDIGFGDIVEQCFVPGPRSARDCEEKIVAARAALPGVRTSVLNIMSEMRARGLREDARVVLGGYPLLALDNGYDLTDGIFNKYNYKVADEIRALGLEGDARQDQIVADANVGHPGQMIHLSGVPWLFNGHEPDGRFNHRNPVRWIWELFETKTKMEWYHMNAPGHAQYAALLKQGGTYGAGGATAGAGGDIDVVLVLDTTGSMGSSIGAVRQYATSLVDQISASTTSARFALVTYRDHPEWTGDPGDYPSRVELGFTSDGASVKNALNSVTVNGGGDWAESMYSGVMAGLGLPWRPGVKKVVVVLSDAPPHDPEPVTGYTAADVITKAYNVDPAEVYLVDTGGATTDSSSSVVNETGGIRIDANSSTDVPAAILEALTTALNKPYAWINGPYVAKVGSTIELDGSGSYASEGSTVATYEWDFNGDGTYDQTSPGPVLSHRFDGPYFGWVGLRVTDSAGRTSVATTHVGITDDGDETPRDQDNCPDIDNADQSDEDGDGVGDMCDDTPGWEHPDADGVVEGPTDPTGTFSWTGFYPPVDNLPTVNAVKAGQSVPVKFSLGGDQGLDILAAGSPASTKVTCDGSATLDPVEQTTTSPSGLTYDQVTGQYTWVWKTQKSWARTCRMLTVTLRDGSTHQALFQIK